MRLRGPDRINWRLASRIQYRIVGLIVPIVPLWLVGVVVVAAAVLTFAASVAPTRRATRIAPVAALAVQ